MKNLSAVPNKGRIKVKVKPRSNLLSVSTLGTVATRDTVTYPSFRPAQDSSAYDDPTYALQQYRATPTAQANQEAGLPAPKSKLEEEELKQKQRMKAVKPGFAFANAKVLLGIAALAVVAVIVVISLVLSGNNDNNDGEEVNNGGIVLQIPLNLQQLSDICNQIRTLRNDGGRIGANDVFNGCLSSSTFFLCDRDISINSTCSADEFCLCGVENVFQGDEACHDLGESPDNGECDLFNLSLLA